MERKRNGARGSKREREKTIGNSLEGNREFRQRE